MLVITAIVTGAAVTIVAVQEDVYQADASLLISPVPAEDPLLSGLGLIRESSDPTLDVQTAAQLITTTAVAEKAADRLGTDESPQELLDDVSVEPVGQSNIVAILAQQNTPERAMAVANAFGEAVVAVRTRDLHAQIDEILPRLEGQLEEFDEGALAADELAQQFSALQSLRAGPDPTVRFETPASLPEERIAPRPLLTILAGFVLGIVIGVAVAFLLRALDPRLRRVEQLRESFRLPILARIPREAHADSKPLGPNRLSPATLEAYRTLRATLTVPRVEGDAPPRSLLVTSASPGDGKTSTAISLAVALARADNRVILIEADLRRPAVQDAFGFGPGHGIASVLRGEVEMASALTPAPGSDGNLMLLMAGRSDGETAELFSLPVGQRLIEEAKKLADYVVVDTPPLAAVVDSMPLAHRVDSVLLVVRLGKTHLRRIRELAEVLAGSGITPAGFAVLGTSQPQEGYYYQQETMAASERRPSRAGVRATRSAR